MSGGPSHSKQFGFTIVEVMISLLLGLMMMIGVVSLMVGNKRSFNEQIEMSRLQENARFAMQLLAQDIRMAGYVGCHNEYGKVANNINVGAVGVDGYLLDMAYPIEALDSSLGQWVPSNAASNDGGHGGENVIALQAAGTDSITLRYFSRTGIVTDSPSSQTSPMRLSSLTDALGVGIGAGDVLAIADCDKAEVFKVTSTVTALPYRVRYLANPAEPANHDDSLDGVYGAGADIFRVHAVRYYIKDNPDGVPSLYRYIFQSDNYVQQEMIPGVENMQILYGNETAYYEAQNVADWEKVNSVKLALLMRTEQEYGTDTDTRTYELLGETIDPDDLRVRRQVITAAIAIRNRL